MNENELIKKLAILLSLFENRPHHLSKYLIENYALNDEFLEKIFNSKKIDYVSKYGFDKNFNSISELNEAYYSIINDIDNKNKKKLEIELNNKLKFLISKERYEEAARVKDYMERHKIKINIK